MIYSRYRVVIPVDRREPPEILRGVMEGMQRMGGKAKMMYSDEERSLIGSELQDYCKNKGIELRTTRGHPAFRKVYKDL